MEQRPDHRLRWKRGRPQSVASKRCPNIASPDRSTALPRSLKLARRLLDSDHRYSKQIAPDRGQIVR